MGQREQLHNLLLTLVPNVYFQPPENYALTYPCIIYSRGTIGDEKYANDKLYLNKHRYDLTIVDYDPDSPILEGIVELPMCSFQRHYTADNLNHDIYNIYY